MPARSAAKIGDCLECKREDVVLRSVERPARGCGDEEVWNASRRSLRVGLSPADWAADTFGAYLRLDGGGGGELSNQGRHLVKESPDRLAEDELKLCQVANFGGGHLQQGGRKEDDVVVSVGRFR